MATTTINFLSADVPLGKSFWLDDQGELCKSSYPNVKHFTSHSVQCSTLREFYTELKNHAAKGYCLIKGKLHRVLNAESRAASTKSDDTTNWICLDLDGAPYATPHDFIKSEPALKDVSYIVQYSASYGINGNTKLSCHIFMMLDAFMPAATLKIWLMGLNLHNASTREGIKLTRTGAGLHWPVDITACQNDKLLYITPPKLNKGVSSTLKDSERIQYVPGKLMVLSTKSITPSAALEALKGEERNLRNDLRVEQKLPPLRSQTQWKGDYEVQPKPGEATPTGVRVERDFVYFNLNGGDSWGYYHPVGNFELIHNFKGEPSYYTRELLPAYYKDQVGTQKAKQGQPTESGETILAFRDKRTAQYWNGTWRPDTQALDLHPARSELQLNHWMQNHGMAPFEIIPVWDIQFDPQSDVIIDEERMTINTYVPTPYFRQEMDPKASLNKCPLIKRIMLHAVSGGKEDETFEHWLNWLAVIFQQRVKPKTAWLFSGTEGCIAGDTVLNFNRGVRPGGRPHTVKEAFEKWSGVSGKWDLSIPTKTRSVKDNMTVGFHEVYRIVESGKQQLYKLTAVDGTFIRATYKHPFMRPDGTFTELKDLRPGDEILQRGDKNQHAVNPKGRNKSRNTTYSIPYHPYGWKHVINGKNYKRAHTARLVWEAAMNGMTLSSFVKILRTDEIKAEQLLYLPENIIVHHTDENPSNDALSNLTTIDKLDHDTHHAKTTGLGTVLTVPIKIKSIVKDKVEMTYDLTMKAPYHNYVANGFCVSNTGKGLMFNNILAPVLGREYVQCKRASELEEKFNGWMEKALIAFIDEVEIPTSTRKELISADLRNFITEDWVTMRGMNRAAVQMRNYTGVAMSTNKSAAVMISANDRRYNIGVHQPKRIAITQQEIDEQIPKELPAFMSYIMTRTANKGVAATALKNAAHAELVESNKTSIDVVAGQLADGDIAGLWDSVTDPGMAMTLGAENAAFAYEYHKILKREIIDTCTAPVSTYRDRILGKKIDKIITNESKLSRDELLVVFEHCVGNMPKTPNKFTSLLKHRNIKTERIRINGALVHGLRVEWKAPRSWLEERMTEFEAQKPSTKLARVK